MPFLHPNERLKVSTLNGFSDLVLLEPLAFRMRERRLLRCRIGATTDGLSGPKFAKFDLQSTNSFFPAVAHDAAYRGDLEESFDGGGTWTRASLTKDEADALLLELCQDNFVPKQEATIIYTAVHLFGQKAWDEDQPLREAIR